MTEYVPENDLRLPKDPAKMTRKDRRKWYHENRKRLKLPAWRDLRNNLEQK